MINKFEKQTKPLTEYEKDTLLPVLVKGLGLRRGEKNAITNGEMCEKLKDKGYPQISQPRIRKIIHHIRVQNLIPCLLSSSKGYYIETNPTDVRTYIESLRQRQSAINQIEVALENQLNNGDDPIQYSLDF